MSGMRKEITKGGTYNWYGDAARQVEIRALEEHGKSIRVLSKDSTKDEVCINGSVVYTIKHRPSKEGHARTDAYVDGRRMGAAFLRKGFPIGSWGK